MKSQTYQAREPTAVETAIKEEYEEGHKLLERVSVSTEVSGFRPEITGAIFCGHLVADLDSIAGAMGASTLYGGTPARASKVQYPYAVKSQVGTNVSTGRFKRSLKSPEGIRRYNVLL